MRFRHKSFGGESGYTLLELLIVLAVLAVLAALVLPHFTVALSRSGSVGLKMQFVKLREACFAFNLDTGGWPVEYSDNPSKSQLLRNVPSVIGWGGPYLGQPLTTNRWGGAVRVRFDGRRNFVVGGFPAPRPTCYLEYTQVPDEVCQEVDLELDGSLSPTEGMVIYAGGELCLLIASGGGPGAPPGRVCSLTIQVQGSGTTSPPPGTHVYPAGTTVHLAATPGSYWHFASWTGNVSDPSSASTSITLHRDEVMVANFEENQPVTLSLGAVQDSYIAQGQPGKNYGRHKHLHVKSKGCHPDNERSLVQFDLSTIPSGARINSARLELYAICVPPSQRAYEVRRMLQAWVEDSVTWSTQPTVAGVTDKAMTPSRGHQWMAWEVAPDVRSFLGGTPNYGWLIKDEAEGTHPARHTIFASRESRSHPGPRLVVTYTPR